MRTYEHKAEAQVHEDAGRQGLGRWRTCCRAHPQHRIHRRPWGRQQPCKQPHETASLHASTCRCCQQGSWSC